MKKLILGAVVAMLTACGVGTGNISNDGDETTHTGSALSYSEFKAKYVFQEPGTERFIADGDTLFTGEKQLREFYDLNFVDGELIVNRVGNADDRWADAKKKQITYCVSNSFGSNKTAIVNAMAAATGAWAAVADIAYVYVPAQDASCTASNNNVVFDVNPINVNGQYIARAFFPSNARADRNVLVDNSAFDPTLSLVGVLRHELGHTLGFRHEHTRPEAGTCFEDNNWRALTPYDSASVMHYPQCNGTGSFDSLAITATDAVGAAALYGAPGGTGGGSGGGAGGGTGGGTTGGGTGGGSTGGGTAGETTETFSSTVARNATKAYGPFAVTPGTNFAADLTGSGDADLYVRFGSAPTASTYNCRPYLNGSAESCDLTVPAGQTTAYINVVGYTASTFNLAVTYTKSTSTPPTGGTAKTSTSSGSVAKNQLAQIAPLTVKPGTTLTVTMSGSGDPDLYVRFGSAPSLTSFDCRPYKTGAAESCSLTVPSTASQVYIGVNGYTAATYTVVTNYTAP